jgi:hypothetical protein
MRIGKRLILMAKTDKKRPEIINILEQPAVDLEAIVPEAEELDNIEAAMGKVAETLNTTRKSNIGSAPGEPAQRQVLIRASVRDHERWKQCAEMKGMALSELIRELCNNLAVEMLECSHPAEFRRTYKWSDTCTRCNTRLR